MRTRRSYFTLTGFLLLTLSGKAFNQQQSMAIQSPDGHTMAEIKIDKQQNLRYRLLYHKKEIVMWSPLGLSLSNGVRLGEHCTLIQREDDTKNETFNWPFGERERVENHYRQTVIELQSNSITFKLQVRLFDGSLAFRYVLPHSDDLYIRRENTEYQLTTPYTLFQYHHESVFMPTTIDSLTTPSDLPSTLTNGHYYISIGEAANTEYTKAQLVKGDTPHTLKTVFTTDRHVQIGDDFVSPWRTVSVALSAIGLHQFSDLSLRLNPQPSQPIPEGVKPGKLIRAQLTTQSGLDCIDFAVKHRYQYIMFDAGWYGAEFRTTSDPTQVIPEIDMPHVISYGKQHGIGVILYVNYVRLRAKLDELLLLYKQWGVSGLKFGFVDGLSQEGIAWLAQAVKKVNDYGFVLNVHDNYKPTGWSRTYPAFLTQEGIRGDENSPDAFHTTTLPFTRFLAGPADFTFCFPNPSNNYSKNIKVSKAHQLALPVIYFSPLQSMLWYGKPTEYTNLDEIEFYDEVPTVWNESHYLAGAIGQYVSVVRRKGDRWFMGNITGFAPWNTTIQLDFLAKNTTYHAVVYEDDGQGGIRKRTFEVKKGDAFPIRLAAKGGQAVIFNPIQQ